MTERELIELAEESGAAIQPEFDLVPLNCGDIVFAPADLQQFAQRYRAMVLSEVMAEVQQEIAAQQEHYGNMGALASTGERIYAEERHLTEGVLLGLDYIISRLNVMAEVQNG